MAGTLYRRWGWAGTSALSLKIWCEALIVARRAYATVRGAGRRPLAPRRARATWRAGHLDIHLFGHLEVALDGARLSIATPASRCRSWPTCCFTGPRRYRASIWPFCSIPTTRRARRARSCARRWPSCPRLLARPSRRAVRHDRRGQSRMEPRCRRLARRRELSRRPRAIAAGWAKRSICIAAISSRRSTTSGSRRSANGIAIPTCVVWSRAYRGGAQKRGPFPVAIETAHRVLAIDPWREDVVRRIIALRYEGGDRAGALGGSRVRQTLARRDGHAADARNRGAGRADYARSQAQLRRRRSEAERAAAIGDGSRVLPFVGRRDEMERLLETWSRAARGRGACAFVVGESGIGKSRIALEFARAVEDRGGRVLLGATSSPEAAPYECIVDALRSALPLVAALRPSIGFGLRRRPRAGGSTARVCAARRPAARRRERAHPSFSNRSFVASADLAAQRPLLLILEDLALRRGPATIEFLQFLVRRVSGAPVMIVVTYRDEETPRLHALHRLRGDARSAAGAQSIWLSRLSMSRSGRVACGAPRRCGIDPPRRSAAASHGNPLFLTQLVVDAREGEPSAAPASLRAVVERRIDRLSEHARTAAEIAACIGDRFSRDAVREVSAWDETALTDALDELVDRRIIREAGGRRLSRIRLHAPASFTRRSHRPYRPRTPPFAAGASLACSRSSIPSASQSSRRCLRPTTNLPATSQTRRAATSRRCAARSRSVRCRKTKAALRSRARAGTRGRACARPTSVGKGHDRVSVGRSHRPRWAHLAELELRRCRGLDDPARSIAATLLRRIEFAGERRRQRGGTPIGGRRFAGSLDERQPREQHGDRVPPPRRSSRSGCRPSRRCFGLRWKSRSRVQPRGGRRSRSGPHALLPSAGGGASRGISKRPTR